MINVHYVQENVALIETKENYGFCRADSNIMYAIANLHMFEEPCISGDSGSGTIFFCGCNLSCIFCQNYKISQTYSKKHIHSVQELANDMIRLQKMGANNINLVTGFMYIPQIIDAIKCARSSGLEIPILYNTSGYENVDSLKLLEGYVDIFLPDLKYADNNLSKKLSGVDNYFNIASEAIMEMYRQVKEPLFDKNGIIKKGLIIRHLVLPDNIDNTRKVLKWIKEKVDKKVYVSIMAQYFPTNRIPLLEKYGINRKLSIEEYKEVEKIVFDYDFNGFIQDIEDDEEKYVPSF